MPVYFVYEPDHLYEFATDGQKIDWMRTNPRVRVEMDEIANHFQWTTVVLYGRYRDWPDLPQYAEERDHAPKLLETRWQTAFASRGLKPAADFISPLFCCIEIDSVTGYRAVPNAGESVSATTT